MAVLVAILIFDLSLVIHRPHVPSMKEATGWVGFYIALALIFAGVLFWMGDSGKATEFMTGWLLEYSLSIDNLFVFIIILSRFTVPKEMQQRILMIGILIAIVLRGIFILVGVRIIEQFSWVFYIFGAYLVYVGFKQAFGHDDDAGEKDSWLIRLLKKRANFTDTWNGGKVTKNIDGTKYLTPFLLVILALGTTDLLFAIDSIPAIFSVTTDPFLVFACNIFALMGLRQLYFLLGGLLERLVYLHYGIAAILAFIGVKLVFHAMKANDVPWINNGEPIKWVPEIQNWHSLLVIVVSMIVAVVASLIKMRRDAQTTGDTSMHIGPSEAELGPDGHYHIVDMTGASFMRPLRVEPTDTGTLTVIDAKGKEAPATQFERETLRAAAREDMDEDELQKVRDHIAKHGDGRDTQDASAAGNDSPEQPTR
ncbi:TerC/Alx family metal homeostasis membrane protein [Epidermidibacterium keratini]|uniref:TerC/Alx family metal homeostasis membrane protein n=2 Tax=Epidermidibacterium keratini TaxID=1891644 RepID=A0A7L4YXM8_9ACTN|nr:TerC/Alx family metal homeostasis membrane protein [Epidermidibacterium keratini]